MANSNSAGEYILSYFAALGNLERAQREARDQAEDKSLPESEQAEAAAAFLDLTDEIARMKSAHEAFMITFTNVNPPSPAVVARAVDLSTKLAADIANSKKAVAILGIVTNFVNAWVKLSQGTPAHATASPPQQDASGSQVGLSSKPKRSTKTKAPKATAWLKAQLTNSKN